MSEAGRFDWSDCRPVERGQLETWCARLFGRRVVTRDSGVTVTLCHWRGRVYLIDRAFEGGRDE